MGLTPEHCAIIDQVEAISKKILYYIPREIGDYTDHGEVHSQNIIYLLDNLLKNFVGYSLEEEEKYLLYLAIWVHDIGNILNRATHQDCTIDLLRNRYFSFLEERLGADIIECLTYVVLAHRSSYNLEDIPESRIHRNVNLPLVCTIFRLLDACDISSKRISPILFDILNENSLIPEEHLPYWEAHKNIISVVFEGSEICIRYIDFDLANVLISHLEEDLEKINIIFRKVSFPQLSLDLVKTEIRY